MGDFNDLLYKSDKKGIHPHPDFLMRGFRNALDNSLLSEVEPHGGRFTWGKGRGTKEWVQERLDRAFMTMDWWTIFTLCKLRVITTVVSDHDTLYLELLNVVVPKKTFRFKFENTWLKEPSFYKGC